MVHYEGKRSRWTSRFALPAVQVIAIAAPKFSFVWLWVATQMIDLETVGSIDHSTWSLVTVGSSLSILAALLLLVWCSLCRSLPSFAGSRASFCQTCAGCDALRSRSTGTPIFRTIFNWPNGRMAEASGKTGLRQEK